MSHLTEREWDDEKKVAAITKKEFKKKAKEKKSKQDKTSEKNEKRSR